MLFEKTAVFFWKWSGVWFNCMLVPTVEIRNIGSSNQWVPFSFDFGNDSFCWYSQVSKYHLYTFVNVRCLVFTFSAKNLKPHETWYSFFADLFVLCRFIIILLPMRFGEAIEGCSLTVQLIFQTIKSPNWPLIAMCLGSWLLRVQWQCLTL